MYVLFQVAYMDGDNIHKFMRKLMEYNMKVSVIFCSYLSFSDKCQIQQNDQNAVPLIERH